MMNFLKTKGINLLASLLLLGYAGKFFWDGHLVRSLVWLLVAFALLVPLVKKRKK